MVSLAEFWCERLKAMKKFTVIILLALAMIVPFGSFSPSCRTADAQKKREEPRKKDPPGQPIVAPKRSHDRPPAPKPRGH